jgi:hypothetical protein
MNFLFGTILAFTFQTDSLMLDTVIESKSIMFKTKAELNVNSYKHKHIQGFFCDFEDNINKNKKIQLNIGVGKQ